MSYLRRLATIVAAVIVTLLAFGTPASAADIVTVEIRGLGDTPIVAGGQSRAFQATFTNTTNDGISGVRAVIGVRLEGASPDSIRLRKRRGEDLPRQASGDTVVFTDPDPFDLQRNGGRGQNRQYTLSFRDDAPGGEATITVAAFKDGSTIGSASASITVVAGEGAPNTDPGFIPTPEAGETYSLVPLPVAEPPERVQASVPRSLYVLGSLLIVMGGASLFLIFKPPGRMSSRVVGAGPHRLPGPSWHPRGPGGGPQAWPTVPRPAEPTRRMDPATGPIRPIRDPGPGEPLPPWLRP